MMGESWAAFRLVGTVPVCSDKLTMDVRAGNRAGRHDLKREAGTGSRGQAFIGAPLMSFKTSASDSGLKDEKVEVAGGSGNVVALGSGAGSDDFIL